MTDLNRMRELAGFHPKQDLISELKVSRDQLLASYDQLIKQVENGNQIDEGFFTSLSAALKTAGQISKKGAKAAAEKVAKLANGVKQMYLDNKAQAELKNMIDSLARIQNTLNTIEKESPTILSRDSEVKHAFNLLIDVLTKITDQVAARLAVPVATSEGRAVSEADIEKILEEATLQADNSFDLYLDTLINETVDLALANKIAAAKSNADLITMSKTLTDVDAKLLLLKQSANFKKGKPAASGEELLNQAKNDKAGAKASLGLA